MHAWIPLLLALACSGDKHDDDDSGTLDGGALDGGAADGGAGDGGSGDGGSGDGGSGDGGSGDGGSGDGGSGDGGSGDGGSGDGGSGDGGSGDGGAGDGGAGDGGAGDGGAGDGGSECTATLDSVDPVNGASDVELDSLISARLSGEDATAEIAVWHSDGTELDGSSTVYETNVVFTPADDLEVDSAYQAVLDWCGGTEVWSFTTVETAEGDPTGTVYALDLTAADWVEPAGAGELLAKYIQGDLLIEVLDLDSTLELRLGWADSSGTRQDRCGATDDLSVSDLSDLPTFVAGPTDLEPDFGDDRVLFGDAMITATFSDDAADLFDVYIDGEVDFRDWLEFLKEAIGSEDPDTMCELMAGFGMDCETCPDGEEYCVPYTVEDVPVSLSSIAVEEITDADVAADPRCD